MHKNEKSIYVMYTYLLKIENHWNKLMILHEDGIEKHKV